MEAEVSPPSPEEKVERLIRNFDRMRGIHRLVVNKSNDHGERLKAHERLIIDQQEAIARLNLQVGRLVDMVDTLVDPTAMAIMECLKTPKRG